MKMIVFRSVFVFLLVLTSVRALGGRFPASQGGGLRSASVWCMVDAGATGDWIEHREAANGFGDLAEGGEGSRQLVRVFKSIQECVDNLHALCSQHIAEDGGEEDFFEYGCSVGHGVYEESVNIHDWPEQCRLRVESVQNERVEMRGTASLSKLDWTVYKGNIVKAVISGDFIQNYSTPFQQLFLGEEMMVEARWPNAKVDEMLLPSTWANTKKGSVYGRIEDAALYEASVNWTGALATLNVAHQFYTWTRYVHSYEADDTSRTAAFTYPKDLPSITSWASRANVTSAWTGHQYFLSGKLAALDSPGEWFLDATVGDNSPEWTLYFWPPAADNGHGQAGTPPDSVEVKVRDVCMNVSNASHLQVVGLEFFACTFSLMGSHNAVVANLSMLYPTYNRLIPEMGPVNVDDDHSDHMQTDAEARLDFLESMGAPKKEKSQQTVVEGNLNLISNLTFRHSNNYGLVIAGGHNRVEEVLVLDTCWLGTLTYPPISASGFNNVITQSTAAYYGNAGITTHGPNHTVSYCHSHHGGLIGLDTAGIYTGSPMDAGADFHHNWVHGMREKCIRGDDLSANMTVHHNVMANCGEPNGDVRAVGMGLVIKGLGHVVYANTIIYCKLVSRCMPACGSPYKAWDCHGNTCPLLIVKQNDNTLYFNNAQRNQTGRQCGCSAKGDDQTAGGIAAGVYNGTAAQMMLENPEHMDYRPTKGSPLVDVGVIRPPYTDGFIGKAPDIGAYEYGGPAWKPGCSIDADC